MGSREKVPPFVAIAGRIFVVTNWDDDAGDVENGNALLLRQLGRTEEQRYRQLVQDALIEAFACTEGVRADRARRRGKR